MRLQFPSWKLGRQCVLRSTTTERTRMKKFVTGPIDVDSPDPAQAQTVPQSYADPGSIYEVVKRLQDVVGAAVGLLLCTPLFVVVALAIRFETPGPVIFRQQRVGRHRKLFWCYKFRTMVDGAEA